MYSLVNDCLIVPFHNMQILKFKAQLMITFYAAANHYRNRHLKAERNKMDQNSSITTQEQVLLNPWKYRTCFLGDCWHGDVLMVCLELDSLYVVEKHFYFCEEKLDYSWDPQNWYFNNKLFRTIIMFNYMWMSSCFPLWQIQQEEILGNTSCKTKWKERIL